MPILFVYIFDMFVHGICLRCKKLRDGRIKMHTVYQFISEPKIEPQKTTFPLTSFME